ncbi:uncharacterized protein LOC127872692 [Dreissena polymorpha]|uniref:uncharacterized protein LOC127872692 n=1 Tax=Dreissena polymorpha TaxID=45954 RepID=UPI002264DC75|nr:uncharacterized protein LOC127872692 [Dreissena polymorpha]
MFWNASEDPALLPRFDISHVFGLSDVSASEDIALTRTSEFEPFDLTRAEVQPPVVIDERNLPEPAVSDSVLTQPETIEYTVVDAGTKRGKPKLVSSDGYSFTFKLKTADVADVFAASRRLVDYHIKVFEATYFNLPKPQTLTRILNRAREKHRPTDPSSLDFEVDTDFIGDGFLRGDVRVDGERHLIFASDDQLSRLQQSNRWFVDGTFHVVRKPFYQLLSVHAFLRHEDCLKQVPLLFVLMSRRRKVDYLAVFRHIFWGLWREEPQVQGFVMDFEIGWFYLF